MPAPPCQHRAMNGFNFTGGTRHALALARDEADQLDHQYVGTEHLLLALLRDRDAEAVLDRLGADRGAIRDVVHRTVGRGTGPPITGPDLPYTSRAKEVLRLAMKEATELRHPSVGPEHLLLGVLRERRGVGAQVLVDAGVTLERARAETLRVLGSMREHPRESPDGGLTVGASAPESASGQSTPPAPDAATEHTGWDRLRHALDISQRLGTTPTLTLEADGSLTASLGPELVITVVLPPDLRLRRREAVGHRPGSGTASTEEAE